LRPQEPENRDGVDDWGRFRYPCRVIETIKIRKRTPSRDGKKKTTIHQHLDFDAPPAPLALRERRREFPSLGEVEWYARSI
jgi:hypothetical protein